MVQRVIRGLWNRPLTWKLSVSLGASVLGLAGLTLLLPEQLATPAFWALLLSWGIVLARTAENNMRNRAQADPAWKRRGSPARRLMYPWWARVIAVAAAALGGAIAAKVTSSYWLPWFLGAMGIGVLVEWLVIRIRAR
jgi:hypothetical protein